MSWHPLAVITHPLCGLTALRWGHLFTCYTGEAHFINLRLSLLASVSLYNGKMQNIFWHWTQIPLEREKWRSTVAMLTDVKRHYRWHRSSYSSYGHTPVLENKSPAAQVTLLITLKRVKRWIMFQVILWQNRVIVCSHCKWDGSIEACKDRCHA